MSDQRAQMQGSTPAHDPAARWSPASPGLSLDVTLYLRRKPGVSSNFDPNHPLSREEAGQALAADPSDLSAVRAFAANFSLQISEENAAARTVHLQGTLANLDRAFGVTLGYVEPPGGSKYISYRGSLTLPVNIAGVVDAVLGLDRRTIARHA